MTSKRTWAVRAATLGLAASVLTGVGVTTAGSASANGSTCPRAGQRPDGVVTALLAPLIGIPGSPKAPFTDDVFSLTGTLDALVCPLLP